MDLVLAFLAGVCVGGAVFYFRGKNTALKQTSDANIESIKHHDYRHEDDPYRHEPGRKK